MIICDSREKKNAHILRYFDRNGIDYIIRKMDVADYQTEGRDKLVIDRKQVKTIRDSQIKVDKKELDALKGIE